MTTHIGKNMQAQNVLRHLSGRSAGPGQGLGKGLPQEELMRSDLQQHGAMSAQPPR